MRHKSLNNKMPVDVTRPSRDGNFFETRNWLGILAFWGGWVYPFEFFSCSFK